MHRSLLLLALASGAIFLALPDTAPLALRAVLKTTPIWSMAYAVSRHTGAYARFILAGLLLCSVGDVVLLLPGNSFVPGLLAFLCGHLAYIAALLAVERRPALPHTVPFLVWGAVMGFLLAPKLGDLFAPVMLYLVIILVMLWRAAARLPGGTAVLAGAVGAVVFGISDTLLAVNKFHTPFAGAGLAVMLTYYAGQAGIAGSVLLRRPR